MDRHQRKWKHWTWDFRLIGKPNKTVDFCGPWSPQTEKIDNSKPTHCLSTFPKKLLHCLSTFPKKLLY